MEPILPTKFIYPVNGIQKANVEIQLSKEQYIISFGENNILQVKTPVIKSTIIDTIINIIVSYFSLNIILDFIVSYGATWKVYSDINCTIEINPQINYLTLTSNIVYVKVTGHDSSIKIYTVNIYRSSTLCDILEINGNLPFGYLIGNNELEASVTNDTTNIILNLKISYGATWKLYSDSNCTVEVIDKTLNLTTEVTIAYIKVTATCGDNKIYELKITKINETIPEITDYTASMIELGQPFKPGEASFANNVWDMQLFNNKIYVGFGDSRTNAGPIPIFCWNPTIEDFQIENINYLSETKTAVDEEQINVFRIIDDKLYIPGIDSRESWSLGNYYVCDIINGWEKFRNVPGGIHVYDIAFFNNKFFIAIGSELGGDVYNSIDGINWTFVGRVARRAYSLVELNNKLYAIHIVTPNGALNSSLTQQYYGFSTVLCSKNINDEIVSNIESIKGEELLPSLQIYDANLVNVYDIKIIKNESFNNRLVFVAGQAYDDFQSIPAGLFVADDINISKKVVLPDQSAMAMDILIRDTYLYVIAFKKITSTEYVNMVYRTTDLNIWEEYFRFNATTFARSFEELNNDFYFGLGCHANYISPSTGKILKCSIV